ncbi:MAG: hypothetical protein HXY34_08430 [Candidatus Thorarchaeota archaeon]|nr:hypothetical protein [Candidatus Thorarchaeota archaeon]
MRFQDEATMRTEKVKAELSNLEVHMGPFRQSALKTKATAVYEDLLLTVTGEKLVVKLHARNMGNVHLEKKAVRIAAMNFEITERDGNPSVVSGSVRLEFESQADADAWYKELWQ